MTPIDLTLICVCLVAVCYVTTLYHLAHGYESKAVERGAQIVIDALRRDGRLMDEPVPPPQEAVNIGEEDYEIEQEPNIPDVIVARSDDHAKQIGDRLVEDLLKGLTK